MDAGKHFFWASAILGLTLLILLAAREWGKAVFSGFFLLLALVCLASWNAGNKK